MHTMRPTPPSSHTLPEAIVMPDRHAAAAMPKFVEGPPLVVAVSDDAPVSALSTAVTLVSPVWTVAGDEDAAKAAAHG